MALADYFPQLQGWKPVSLSAPSNAPQIPNDQTVRSAYLRTTLPLPLQYSGDTVKQYNSPGLSTFRIAPLPPNGIAASVAAAASTATTIINNETTGGGSGGISSVTLNVPVEFTPTTQTGEDLTIAWAPELSGSIFSGPINGGVTGLDSAANNGNANSTLISVSDTPNNPGVAALLLMNLSGSQTPVLDQFSPNPGAGWTALDTAVSGQFASLYTKYIPTPTLVNPSATLATGCAWTACLMMLGTTAAAVPVIRQQVSLGSGATTNGTTGVNITQSFSSPTLVGSLILVIMNEGGGTSGTVDSFVIASVSDTQSNNFLKIAGSQSGTGGASPSTFQSQSIVFAAFNTPGGADTVTMNVKASQATGGGGFFTATYAGTAYEITGLGPISGIPSFKQASTLGLQPITFQTNGTKNGSQNLLNLVGGTGATVVDDGSGDITIASDPPFSSITSGTSTSAVTMVVGSTSSLGHTGTGTIDSTSINGVAITGGPSAGQVPTATGSATATWQTPPAVVTSLNGLNGALSLTSTGSTITITPSGSTINLETAGGGGGIPAGSNVVLLPFPNSSDSSFSGLTVVMRIPATAIANQASKLKITWTILGGTQTVGAAVLRTIPIGSSTIDAGSTAITWSGNPTPTLVVGANVSDAITFTVNGTKDVLIMVYLSSTSTDTLPKQSSPPFITSWGWVSGNQTGASSYPSLTGDPVGVTRVVTA